MSEPEARRIMAALPAPGSADEAFMPALQEIIKVTEMKLSNRIKVLKSQGTIGVEALEELSNETKKAGTGTAPKGKPKVDEKAVLIDAGVTKFLQSNRIKDTPANRAWAKKKLGM